MLTGQSRRADTALSLYPFIYIEMIALSLRGILFAALLSLWSLSASAQSLHIAAASDLVYCLEELNATFRRNEPAAEIKTTLGSSGNFFAQISNGAPFEIFLSADMQYPRALVKAGLADEASLTPYATGRIAIWSMNSRLDLGRGLATLADPAVRRIAIANPEHAPYGRAAQAALRNAGLWETVKPRLVMGENIAQAAQFVQTGNADVGIVALSLLKSPKMAGMGQYREVPSDLFPALEQGAVLTRNGANSALARRYLAFLRSVEARAIFEKYGFILPSR